MRICHVIESGGGSGQVVVDLALQQAAGGHDVTIIYSPARAWPQFVERLTGVDNIKMLTLPMQRQVGPKDIVSAFNLWKMLRQEGPFEMIHSHSSKAGALARMAGIFLTARQVYTPHGFITLVPHAGGHYRIIERFLSVFCDKVIAVSIKERDHALGLGITKHRLAIIPNGTRCRPVLTPAEARQRLSLPATGRVVGFTGRFSFQKSPALAVETFSILAKTYPDITLCMIGDGELAEDVKRAVNVSPAKDRIVLAGLQDAAPLMSAFDVLLCTSVYEGMPIAFIESLSAGIPIVSTDIGGADEAIVEGETGYVAKSMDAEGLAAACAALLDLSDAQRDAMRGQVKQRSELFTSEAMAANAMSLYRSLVPTAAI
jgi:glycosyltransferase involved in cell wall biosynthesis